MAWRPEAERKPNRLRSSKTNKLKAWRTSQGLSQQEVGDLVGLNVASISRIESGERGVATLTRVRIARRLGVRIADIWDVEPVE